MVEQLVHLDRLLVPFVYFLVHLLVPGSFAGSLISLAVSPAGSLGSFAVSLVLLARALGLLVESLASNAGSPCSIAGSLSPVV